MIPQRILALYLEDIRRFSGITTRHRSCWSTLRLLMSIAFGGEQTMSCVGIGRFRSLPIGRSHSDAGRGDGGVGEYVIIHLVKT